MVFYLHVHLNGYQIAIDILFTVFAFLSTFVSPAFLIGGGISLETNGDMVIKLNFPELITASYEVLAGNYA